MNVLCCLELFSKLQNTHLSLTMWRRTEKWACNFSKVIKGQFKICQPRDGKVSSGWKNYYFACTGEGRLLLIFCFEFGEELSPSSESFDDVITERRIKIS